MFKDIINARLYFIAISALILWFCACGCKTSSSTAKTHPIKYGIRAVENYNDYAEICPLYQFKSNPYFHDYNIGDTIHVNKYSLRIEEKSDTNTTRFLVVNKTQIKRHFK